MKKVKETSKILPPSNYIYKGELENIKIDINNVSSKLDELFENETNIKKLIVELGYIEKEGLTTDYSDYNYDRALSDISLGLNISTL